MKNLKAKQKERRKARIKGKIKANNVEANKPRLVVFKSISNNYAQLVDDQNKITLASTSDLKLDQGTKIEKAKQVGIDLAKLAKEKKISECVFDRNGFKYHGRIKAIAEGAREGGLKF